MKKRFLAAVLALTMTAACLTACGGENKTEDKQQTTTTTTAETTTTTTAETTTTTEKETGVIDTTTTTKVTPAEGGVVPPSEIPQDLNPGAWLEDSETTTTTTTTKAATTTKPKTTTTKAKTTTTKATTTTTKATTTKAKVSTTNGYWHEDPGITKADLKAAAEAAFAKVKKTAKEYGWTISKTFVNRSTDTQYGIYCRFEISEAASADGAHHTASIVIKAEAVSGSVIVQASQTPLGVSVNSENYDDFSGKYDISYLIESLKERY